MMGRHPHPEGCGVGVDVHHLRRLEHRSHQGRHQGTGVATSNSGFLPEERAWMDKLFPMGWIDAFRVVNQSPDNTPGGPTVARPGQQCRLAHRLPGGDARSAQAYSGPYLPQQALLRPRRWIVDYDLDL